MKPKSYHVGADAARFYNDLGVCVLVLGWRQYADLTAKMTAVIATKPQWKDEENE